MDIDKLLEPVPHATFHDALLQSMHVDYVAKKAVFDFLICVGDPGAKDEASREEHRAGKLVVSGLHFCVVDPPDSTYPYSEREGLWVCSIEITELGAARRLLKALPDDSFTAGFFVNDWNSFIYLAGKRAHFKWG